MALDDIRKKIKDLKSTLETEGSEILQEEAKKIFEKYPELDNFAWTQYTCYFNDGEACYFSANTYEYCLELNSENMDEYEETEDAAWRQDAAKEISKLLESVDDILEDLYGDHVKVKFKRNGQVKKSDYSNHD